MTSSELSPEELASIEQQVRPEEASALASRTVVRVRLAKVLVQPVIVVDDGTDLVELSAQPFEVRASQLDGLAGRIRAELEERHDELIAMANLDG